MEIVGLSTHPLPNFNGGLVKLNYISHETDVCTYPCYNVS